MKVRFLISAIIVALLMSCTSSKNTSGTRWYHAFNTRYNIYFNGNEAFNETYKSQLETYTENYSEIIMMHPVSALPKDKEKSGGPFDKSIEKAVKAIKLHSIQTKPERDGGKRNDPDYKAFMKRTEFNPFLHNAWMMMAKSQFYNGDFLEAASTFSYISRLYEAQAEVAIPAKIWKARCYSEIGWFYDAEDILSKINNEQLPKKQIDWYATVYADFLIKQKKYADAVPYMKIAVKAEKNKLQRSREKYLLGQMYAATEQKGMAYKTFGEVVSSTAPYVLELNARIRQTEVYPGGDIKKMTKKLNKMAKSSKNKEYLDQVYYALGNVYMTVPDTTKALESYELGSEKSTRNGIDKAMNQIQLGDIYFDMRKYVKAQPNYSDALGQLKKEDEAYPRVSKRSEVLDALVVHYEAVELQDSLQRLSKMTEEERLKVVEKIIEDLKKKEKEEQEKAEQAEYQEQRQQLQSQQKQTAKKTNPPPAVMPPSDGSFYFYNQQAIANGKNAFQQKWGRRKLEDDWRRRNKTNLISDTAEETELVAETDTLQTEQVVDTESLETDSLSAGTEKTLSEDLYDPQFYLQQIPVTEEDIEASNLIIQDGLYNMGVIYKEMLEDTDLAIETLELLNSRFPENENKMNVYYHIYLIYWKLNDMEMANIYKNKIRTEFPESDLAIAMADPDYEYNQKMMDVVQDSLYRKTYEAYLDNKPMEIRKIYQDISSKYNKSKLMPKFMFLNALSYAQTHDADNFKILLKELIEKYPSEDVSLLAGDMMKGFQHGLLLAASGDNMLARGSLFNMRFGASDDSIGLDSLAFSTEINMPHKLMLLYPKETIDNNMLLFTVASFNFGNFMVNDFELTQTETGNIDLLQIDGFNNQEEVLQYYKMIVGPEGYTKNMDEVIIIVPISVDNYNTLMKGKSLDEYMTFFEENFTKGNEEMIAKWRLKQEKEKEVIIEIPDPIEEDIEETETTIEEKNPVKPENIKEAEKAVPDSLAKENLPVTDKTETSSDKTDEAIENAYQEASDKMDDITKTYNEASSDPIRWFLSLFKRKKSTNAIDEYAKQQEEELKKQKKENDALLKVQKKQEEDLAKIKENEKKQEESLTKRLAKEKEDAKNAEKKRKKAEQKEKEKKRKEAQKLKKAEREAKAKARKKK